MVLTFEVTPEEAKRVEWAKSRGFDVNAMLRGLIASLPVAPEIQETKTKEATAQETALTPQERARMFMEWAESHSRDTPLLSDEAISRESIVARLIPTCRF